MSVVRKFVGRAKYNLVDYWPYIPAMNKSVQARERMAASLMTLPALSPNPKPQHEVHMLCGKKDSDMALWASWSLLRFLPDAHLFIHSDGTFGTDDSRRLCACVGNVSVISKEERDILSERLLREAFPQLYVWRKKNFYGAKFLDFHLYGSSDRFLICDTDVLCFNRPDEVIRILQEGPPSLRWNTDNRTSYLISCDRLKTFVGGGLPEKLNAGFMVTKRWNSEDLAYFDNLLLRLEQSGIDTSHYRCEPSLYVASCIRHASYGPLSEAYSVVGGKTSSRSVIRHYVGVPKIRYRFFLEGVPMLLKQIQGGTTWQAR